MRKQRSREAKSLSQGHTEQVNDGIWLRIVGLCQKEPGPNNQLYNQMMWLYSAMWHIHYDVMAEYEHDMIPILQVLNLRDNWCCCWLIAQLCPTLCDPIDCSLLGSSVHEFSQVRILVWVGHFLLQGIFLTLGSNPHLLWILSYWATWETLRSNYRL